MARIPRESGWQGPFGLPRRIWIAGMVALAVSGRGMAAEPTTRSAPPRAGQARQAGGVASPSRPAAGRSGERVSARSPKVDHAVMPAGGMVGGQSRCSQCQRSACPQCRLAEAHHHGHSQCQHGLCPAHCPVRPDVFGFYGTQWRRWPGSGVIQASDNEAAAPVRPPRAEVPGAEEESLVPDAAADELPAPAAEDLSEEPQAPKPAAGAQPAAKPSPAGDSQSSRQQTSDQQAAVVDGTTVTATDGEAAPTPLSDETVGDEPKDEASPTAWRTFTAAPPRLAVQR